MTHELHRVSLRLIRHGESQWQTGASTSLNSPLTALGAQQSEWTARHVTALLGGADAALFSSPLIRALHTTHAIQRLTGLPATILPTLAEAPFHVASALARFDHPLQAHPSRPADLTLSAEFLDGVSSSVQTIVATAVEARVPAVVIAHGGVIKSALRHLLGTDAACFHIDNGSISELIWRRGRWHLASLNNTAHLLGMEAVALA